MYSVHLVEDDHNLNEVLTSYLKNQGWQVRSFVSGRDARLQVENEPHLWILDIMLPDITGYDLIRDIKAYSPRTPVIFISARDAELDRLLGLEMGSEDYIAKPFLPKELVLRAQRLLERIYGRSERPALNLGGYSIDPTSRMVTFGSQLIYLTSKEFDLLEYLANNLGRALTREQILAAVWGPTYFGSDRVVDDLVRRLRRRLPQARIEAIYGYGYRVVAP